MIKNGRVEPGQSRDTGGRPVTEVRDGVPLSDNDRQGLAHPRSVQKQARRQSDGEQTPSQSQEREG